MLHSNEEYIEKLLKELKLHDSDVIGLKLYDDSFQIDISCEGMQLDSYFNDIDNVVITIKVYGIIRVEFDYLGGTIFVDEINIVKNDDKVHISINENSLDVIGNKYEILCKENKKYNESYRKLDNFLKNH